jgi:hypothetical protein
VEGINRAYDLAVTCDADPDYDEIAGVAHIFLRGPGGAVLPALVAAPQMANQGALR